VDVLVFFMYAGAIVRGSYEQGCAGKLLKAEQIKTKYLAMSEKDAAKEIRGLEKDMPQAAKNLDFERAAGLRDELRKLREVVLFEPGRFIGGKRAL